MNWKLNYWTLLFALTLAFTAYQQFTANPQPSPEMASKRPEDEIFLCKATDIPDGKSRIDNYRNRVALCAVPGIVNPNVRSFLLAKCELQQMLSFTGPKDSVVAEMALNTSPQSLSDTIDMVFKVYNANNQVKYYDFSTPCPPGCVSGQ